jgi:hypothetical protein
MVLTLISLEGHKILPRRRGAPKVTTQQNTSPTPEITLQVLEYNFPTPPKRMEITILSSTTAAQLHQTIQEKFHRPIGFLVMWKRGKGKIELAIEPVKTTLFEMGFSSTEWVEFGYSAVFPFPYY